MYRRVFFFSVRWNYECIEINYCIFGGKIFRYERRWTVFLVHTLSLDHQFVYKLVTLPYWLWKKPIESCQKPVKPVRFVYFSDWYGLVGILRIRSFGCHATLILQCKGALCDNRSNVCEGYCALQKVLVVNNKETWDYQLANCCPVTRISFASCWKADEILVVNWTLIT